MSDTIQKYQEIRDEIRRLREQANQLMRETFFDGIRSVFESNQNLVSFSWNQYTPYFNDGDECVFRVHKEYLDIVFRDENGEEIVEEELSSWSITFNNGEYLSEFVKNNEQNKQSCLDIIAYLDTFEEEDYKEAFGDHVRVTVSGSGVEVDSYNHD